MGPRKHCPTILARAIADKERLSFSAKVEGLKNIHQISYEQYVTEMRALANRDPLVTVEKIGESAGMVFQETEYWSYFRVTKRPLAQPIFALVRASEQQPKGTVVIVAGHHSTEEAGPVAALEFTRRLLESDSKLSTTLKKHYRVVVVPVVDVDHYSLPSSERTYSYTTNNFYHRLTPATEWEFFRKLQKPLSSGPEARAVADTVKTAHERAPITVALDLHENGRTDKYDEGFFLFGTVATKPDLTEGIRSRLLKEHLPVAPSGRWGTKDEFEDPTTFADFAAGLGATSLTFETAKYGRKGVRNDPNVRVQTHLTAIEEVLLRTIGSEN